MFIIHSFLYVLQHICKHIQFRAHKRNKKCRKLHLCAGCLNIKSSPFQITICDPETIFRVASVLWLMRARERACLYVSTSKRERAGNCPWDAHRNNAKDALGECVIIASCSTRISSGGGARERFSIRAHHRTHIPTNPAHK